MTKKSAKTKITKFAKKASSNVKKAVKNSVSKKTPPKKTLKVKKTNKTVAKSAKKQQPLRRSQKEKITKSPKTSKKSGSNSSIKGYTTSQYERFLTEKKNLEGCSNQELKDMLRKNLQSMSGNKSDLIYKVADGMILGRIPRCPKCFGGRPKFDFKKGTYYCSGYRDDEDFKNCHSTFQLGQITRSKWE